jgi:ATP adenylyltransferase
MKHLWAPWRMAYIKTFRRGGCVFCQALAEPSDGVENLIVFRGNNAFVILNRFPYTSGHVMILPYKHAPHLDDLDPETRAEMFELVNQATLVLQEIYKPQGFNIGINIGEAAGAGIEEHIHIHIVPRWMGDTNYMTSVGQTRVVPEPLDETYRQVKSVW